MFHNSFHHALLPILLMQNEPAPGVLGLQQRYARLPGSPLTAAFNCSLVVAAPLPSPSSGSVPVAVTFDIVQAPSAFCLPVMQKRAWDPPFQVGAPVQGQRWMGSSALGPTYNNPGVVQKHAVTPTPALGTCLTRPGAESASVTTSLPPPPCAACRSG